MSRSSSYVTVYDVARAAGVSQTAVSAALSGRGRISEERAREIRKIAEEMGYHPQIAAQLLRAKQTGRVGLIAPALEYSAESGFVSPLIARFVSTCETHQLLYHIEFFRSGEDDELVIPNQLLGRLVDGVVLTGVVNTKLRQWLAAQQKFWISIDEPAPYSVLSATNRGIYKAVEELAKLGHRRIAYTGGSPNRYLACRLAMEGFRQAAVDFNLTPLSRLWMQELGDFPRRECMQEYMEWANRLLDLPDRPTAVVCHGMGMAIARCLIYAAVQRGLRIPQDLSVIAIGTPADAEKGYPCLSSIEHDFPVLVESAVSMLRERIAGKLDDPKTIRVEQKLVMRDTVAQACPA